MKIYVASSWRNEYQPEAVRKLRTLGHEVYDFRGSGDGWTDSDGKGGFHWSEIDKDWKAWPNNVKWYLTCLNHPRANAAFKRDMDALIKCDACIMVNPCGPSSHQELGWAKGAGKLTAIWSPEIREPDLIEKMADHITDSWRSIEFWLRVPLEL